MRSQKEKTNRTETMNPFTGTPESWNELIASLPLAHLFQTWQWSQVKARSGWQPIPFVWQDETGKPVAAAMVLKQAIPVRGLAKKICALYIPRGPLMDWNDAALRLRILEDLQAFSHNVRVPSISKSTRMWRWGLAFSGRRTPSSLLKGRPSVLTCSGSGGNIRRNRSSTTTLF